MLDGVKFASDPYDAAAGADALVVITEWEAFRALDLARLKTLLRQPIIVDLRNIYRPVDVAAAGFSYFSIGRATGAASAGDDRLRPVLVGGGSR